MNFALSVYFHPHSILEVLWLTDFDTFCKQDNVIFTHRLVEEDPVFAETIS